MKTNRPLWTEMEKYQLWVAYSLSLPIKVMAKWFKRSPSSINHALGRHGIRVEGQRKKHTEISTRQEFAEAVEQFSSTLQKCGLATDLLSYNMPIGVKREYMSNVILTDQHKAELKQLGLSYPPPWHPASNAPTLTINLLKLEERLGLSSSCQSFGKCNIEAKRARTELARSAYQWVNLSTVIEYLKDKNFIVERYPCHYLQQSMGWRYLVEGQPMTSFQVLITANRIRAGHGHDPFLVEGLSCQ